ncbi:hypothetical protein EV363DRAFT_1425867 [Boletus edulis]|nr:hypothetical protein EV363DRAFT_1425867 [Boletus edulis]
MAPSLCENCHKRPKSGTHRFCGKTCAAQAAAKPARSKQSQSKGHAAPRNAGHQKGAPAPQKVVQLCSHCGQKPKFNGFDYCGKSCAALAGATQPTAQGVRTTKQKTAHSSNAPPSNPPATPPAKPHKVPQTKASVPQDDSAEEEEEPEEEDDDEGVSTDLDAYPSDSEDESEDEPSAPAVAPAQAAAKNMSRGGKPNSGVPRVVPGTCAIPGCGQPSHADRRGVKTMYCSTRHREEAVKLGLEAACIMCQQYPQNASDYFCSSACRSQSMTKT